MRQLSTQSGGLMAAASSPPWLALREDVAIALEEDGGVLLNTRTGRSFVADRVAVCMLRAGLKGQSRDASAIELAMQFPVSYDHAARSLQGFQQKLADLGFVAKPEERRRKLIRLAWMAWWALLRYDLNYARIGFHYIRRLITRRCLWPERPPEGTTAIVCDAVNLAACFYPRHVFCLQKSAVTARLLRQCGVDAQVVFLYRLSPFMEHAVVEVDGGIVNDSAAYKSELKEVWRLP